MTDDNPYPLLLGTMAGLSLLGIGGANTTLPEMHRQFVEIAHWFTDAEFTQMYALAQAAPGPNIMVTAIFGWRVASFAGAVLAPFAYCLPSSILTFLMGRLWHRFHASPWRDRLTLALTPLSAGLVCSTGFILAGDRDTGGLMPLALTAITFAVTQFTRLNPLWCLGGAGLVGLLGF